MYHSIGGADNKEAGAELYSVPVEKFREQIRELKDAGMVIGSHGMTEFRSRSGSE